MNYDTPPNMESKVPTSEASEIKNPEIDKKENSTIENEKNKVSTLMSLKSRLGYALECFESKKGYGDDALNDKKLLQTIFEETGPLRISAFLDSFDEKHKEALTLAKDLIMGAYRTTQEQKSLDISSNEIRLEVYRKIQAAKTITDLMWELQPKKTHEDFEEKI